MWITALFKHLHLTLSGGGPLPRGERPCDYYREIDQLDSLSENYQFTDSQLATCDAIFVCSKIESCNVNMNYIDILWFLSVNKEILIYHLPVLHFFSLLVSLVTFYILILKLLHGFQFLNRVNSNSDEEF